jgi:4-amino-4-deoxy-L-arabinose transferase-like glycosyltransferase
MVALFIRAGTELAGEGAFGIRLIGPLSMALASLAVARAAEDLAPGRRAGPWAALLLNATPLLGVGAVVMTPDLPLLVFWCVALWACGRLVATGDGRWWLAIGAACGLALLSKYTAVLLGLGLVVWLVASRPAWRWWATPWPYAGGVLAALVFSPVIAWNAAHGWASFAKQGGRAGAETGGFTLRWIGELVAGQFGIASPIIFVLCIAGTAAAVAAWRRRGESGAALLVALVLPGAALFCWQALGSRVQGNWPALLYPAACIAAAAYAPSGLWRWRRAGIALAVVITAAVYVQASLAPIALPRRQDPTLARLGGWDALAAEAEAARLRHGATFLAAEEYGLAAQLALRVPQGVPVVAMDARWALFSLPAPEAGVTGLLVRSERRGEGPPLWPGAEATGEVLVRSRHGVEAERYRLHRVQAGPGQPPAAVLPRPRA